VPMGPKMAPFCTLTSPVSESNRIAAHYARGDGGKSRRRSSRNAPGYAFGPA
jgi:hypothetical protein